MSNNKVRRTVYSVRSIKVFTLYPVLRTQFLLFLLCAVCLAGCVRVSGTAGYWKTGEEGETTAKRASFDTADFVPGSPTPGKITV